MRRFLTVIFLFAYNSDALCNSNFDTTKKMVSQLNAVGQTPRFNSEVEFLSFMNCRERKRLDVHYREMVERRGRRGNESVAIRSLNDQPIIIENSSTPFNKVLVYFYTNGSVRTIITQLNFRDQPVDNFDYSKVYLINTADGSFFGTLSGLTYDAIKDAYKNLAITNINPLNQPTEATIETPEKQAVETAPVVDDLTVASDDAANTDTTSIDQPTEAVAEDIPEQSFEPAPATNDDRAVSDNAANTNVEPETQLIE